MKQKIVIKVHMTCDKCRSKAMKIAAVAEGVTSVAIAGAERDQVVVTGDGVDSASLTCSLRKKVGYASLVSVEEVKEKKPDPPKKKDPIPCCPSTYINPCPQYAMYPVVCDPNPPVCSMYPVVCDPNPPVCSIM